jgi:CPW-WPC domain-containing protein
MFVFLCFLSLAQQSFIPQDPTAVAGAFQRAQQVAFSKALRQQQTAAGQSVLTTEVSRIINYRMAMHYFGGACVRDYAAACPLGWGEEKSGEAAVACTPPAEYEGPCKAGPEVLKKSASPEVKTEVAVRCEAEWPCKVCPKRYDTCPQRWTLDEAKCKAPRDYDGDCETLIDFSSMSDFHKARWAARCRAVWPCDARPPVHPASVPN